MDVNKKLFEVSFYETLKVTRVVVAVDEADALATAHHKDRVLDETTEDRRASPERDWDVKFIKVVPEGVEPDEALDLPDLVELLDDDFKS